MANEMTSDKFGMSMANCIHGTLHPRRGWDVELSEGDTVALIRGVDLSHTNGSPVKIDMCRIVFSMEYCM